MDSPTSLEICAGGGGQALGLEQAGFAHVGLVELDETSCATLQRNRPLWNVIQDDVRDFDGRPYRGIDLLAGGIPCPPFSIAGKQLGNQDERDLFPSVLRLTEQIRPQAVMIENVRGLLGARFERYRAEISTALDYLGYKTRWGLFNARDFGVPQLRPRALMVAICHHRSELFDWPRTENVRAPTVGDALFDLMAAGGWRGASDWKEGASGIAPTIVGGSHKHGGPDLGPVRARQAWARLGVNGLGIADGPPEPDFNGSPKLTVPMVARLQGFPDDWLFAGRKTKAYRQIGNAFPPPVARAVGTQLLECLGERQMVLMEPRW
ncbi:MAG: DNA (cytosine-5-)-methyltransferase [Armatimonadetes bacterium]|nr:DNA (cytosine-5-)-methyltransferase [Armatimonadota bacterium]